MILLIDNYDSFTYNLVQRLGELDANIDLQVYRNDQITTQQIDDLKPTHIIISPGPCTPRDACLSGRAGPRRNDDVGWFQVVDLLGRDLIIAVDLQVDVRIQLAQPLHQVVRERIVVIDEENHVH